MLELSREHSTEKKGGKGGKKGKARPPFVVIKTSENPKQKPRGTWLGRVKGKILAKERVQNPRGGGCIRRKKCEWEKIGDLPSQLML